MIRVAIGAAISLLLASAVPATAQGMRMEAIPAPVDTAAIPLGTGGVEGATAPESWFISGTQRTVRNVQQATLTPVLPDPAKATGAAVIVAPGGGFLMLSMDNEGWPVARWLADHGIAAFVLKYRLKPTSRDMADFQKELGTFFARAARADTRVVDGASRAAIEDGQAALALVRARAGTWGIDPKRVGMLGFSAGAMTILGVTLAATPETMPAFIAPIYGSMEPVVVPAAAPPMFSVLAGDDPLFARKGLGLIEAWQVARKPVEFHLYQKGGHGFGMGATGTTSTGWIVAFRNWLAADGFLEPKR
jgi:acetyl esterase/lipase